MRVYDITGITIYLLRYGIQSDFGLEFLKMRTSGLFMITTVKTVIYV